MDRLDNLWVGLLAGLIGPWLGGLLFYLFMFNHKPLSTFITMIITTSSTHSALLSVSLVFNLAFFFLFLQRDWYKAARGVILSVFVYAPFVVYFEYVT